MHKELEKESTNIPSLTVQEIINMSTPRKSFYQNSPYANPMQQYPSQSEDYISLDMGGAIQRDSIDRTPDHYTSKYYQQNYRNSSSKANRRNLFNNSFGNHNNRHSFSHRKQYGSRNSFDRPQQQQNIHSSNEKSIHNKKNTSFTGSYCHPSMTEDPWFELEQRMLSLEKSKISPKSKSPPQNNSPPPDTCSNPNSDNEQ